MLLGSARYFILLGSAAVTVTWAQGAPAPPRAPNPHVKIENDKKQGCGPSHPKVDATAGMIVDYAPGMPDDLTSAKELAAKGTYVVIGTLKSLISYRRSETWAGVNPDNIMTDAVVTISRVLQAPPTASAWAAGADMTVLAHGGFGIDTDGTCISVSGPALNLQVGSRYIVIASERTKDGAVVTPMWNAWLRIMPDGSVVDDSTRANVGSQPTVLAAIEAAIATKSQQ